MQNFIHISDAAAIKLNELFQEEKNPKLKVRLFVAGGGCSGFQYGFQFDDKVAKEDTLIEKDIEVEKQKFKLSFIADPMSVQYLDGVMINYKILADQEGHFSIRNPNIQTGCPGCASAMGAE